MQIRPQFPPNYDKIKQVLNPPKDAIFAYGNTIYNPSGLEIFHDQHLHETIHQGQQELFSSVELWWDKYLLDRAFREKMEVEAFGDQYRILKLMVPNKALKVFLDEMATSLSTNYKLDITYSQAETKIRKYGTRNVDAVAYNRKQMEEYRRHHTPPS